MSILVNRGTRLVVHGVDDEAGRRQALACRGYGQGRRCVVAGVAPRGGPRSIDGIPVFDSIAEARAATGADACVVDADAATAGDAIAEAGEVGLPLVVCVGDGAPVAGPRDARRLNGTRLLGPGCAGVMTPGEIRIGPLPDQAPQRGRIGVIVRSGPLLAELARQFRPHGLGASTVVALPAQHCHGLAHLELLQLFEADPGTDAVLLAGPLDEESEAECTAWMARHMRKPVVGWTGPGAAAAAQRARLSASGVHMTDDVATLGTLTASVVDPPWLPFD